jgi:HEAT repeat protein
MLILILVAALTAETDLLEPRRFAADGTPWRQTEPLTDGQIAEARRKHPALEAWLERVKKERSIALRVDAVNTLAAIARHPHTLEPDRHACSTTALSLLADREPAIRRKALLVLDAYADEAKCRGKLSDCLKDRERGIREAALKLLTKYGDDSSVKPIVTLAGRDQVLREDCIVTLISIGTPAARDAIEIMARKSSDPRDRERLLVAIDQINRTEKR